tara:strand:- start:155 stop:301 length:147 start_codon:yes stop_codon:yes gene_type:complete
MGPVVVPFAQDLELLEQTVPQSRAQKVNSFVATGSAGGRAGKWFLWRY